MHPESDVERIRQWVDAKIRTLPESIRADHGFEVETSDRAVTVYEVGPPLGPDAEPVRSPVVRFRYTAKHQQWTLYWADRDGEFHLYEFTKPKQNISKLLVVVDDDQTGIFWG